MEGLKPSAESVLDLLRRRPQGATAIDALAAGCGFRLGARVWELRTAGLEIETRWETTPRGARIARYVLHENAQLTLGVA